MNVEVMNERILDELKGIREELLTLIRASEHYSTISREQHRRITSIETSTNRLVWGLLTGGATFVTTIVVTLITILL